MNEADALRAARTVRGLLTGEQVQGDGFLISHICAPEKEPILRRAMDDSVSSRTPAEFT